MTSAQKLDERRPRRSKRRALLFSVLPVVLPPLGVLGYWWINDYTARRAFQRAVDTRRARGEPALPADLQPGWISDDQNAAYFLRRASAALKLSDAQEDKLLRAFEGWPLTQANAQFVESVAAANAEALTLVRRARQCPGANWGLDYTKHPIITELDLSHLGRVRWLAHVSRAAALYQHRLGDDAAALDHIQSILAMARAVDSGGAVPRLVSLGICSLASETCLDLCDTLKVKRSNDDTARGGADPQRVHEIIDWFINDDRRRQEIVAAWHVRRVEDVDAVLCVGSQHSSIRPQITRLAVYAMELDDAALVAALEPTWPAACKRFTALPEPPSSPFSAIGDSLRGIAKPLALQEFHGAIDARATAVGLAARLYVVDHDGRWPEQLSDLVPSQLKQLPFDPFDPENKPLRFKNSADSVIVYGVGLDGEDNGGDARQGPSRHRDVLGGIDMVYPLVHRERSAPPDDADKP